MTGLRDRKKQEVRHRVVQAATSLFADRGLDDTTMESIAAAADVSVGTVYNYFGSKNSLLVAAVEEDTEKMTRSGAVVLGDPGRDAADAVKRLLDIYVTHLSEWDPRLLREVMGAAFARAGGEELSAELAHIDQRLVDQLVELLSHFRATGRLRSGVEVEDAALLLFSAFAIQLFLFIGLEGHSTSDLHVQVGRQVDLAFLGLSTTTTKKAK